MTDENQSIISWLKGLVSGPDTPKNYIAQPRTQYPTSDDVDFARKYDYSYGQPWAPEFEGHSVRLLSGDPNKSPMKTEVFGTDKKTVDQLIPGVTDPLKDAYAKAALASEGSALAKLGFDPNKAALDITRDPSKVNMTGFYTPEYDQIYSNIRDPSTLVHESIHRGIHRLQDSPFWKPEFNEMLGDNTNEYLVRHLMQTKMGDPEAGGEGAIDKAQQAAARLMFERSSDSKRRQGIVDQMEQAAANYIAAKHPGGPR